MASPSYQELGGFKVWGLPHLESEAKKCILRFSQGVPGVPLMQMPCLD